MNKKMIPVVAVPESITVLEEKIAGLTERKEFLEKKIEYLTKKVEDLDNMLYGEKKYSQMYSRKE